MKVYWEVDVWLHSFLTSADAWSASHTGRIAPQGKSQRYPLNRRLNGSRMYVYVVFVNRSAQTLLVSPVTVLRTGSAKCNIIKICSFVSLSWLSADRCTQVNRLIPSDCYETRQNWVNSCSLKSYECRIMSCCRSYSHLGNTFSIFLIEVH
jgi:hypothetical protein